MASRRSPRNNLMESFDSVASPPPARHMRAPPSGRRPTPPTAAAALTRGRTPTPSTGGTTRQTPRIGGSTRQTPSTGGSSVTTRSRSPRSSPRLAMKSPKLYPLYGPHGGRKVQLTIHKHARVPKRRGGPSMGPTRPARRSNLGHGWTENQVKARKRFSQQQKMVREMKELQVASKTIIPKARFQKVVKEIAQDMKSDVRMETSALELLHMAAEAYLVEIFQDGRIVRDSGASVRHTLTLKHFIAAIKIRGDDIPEDLDRWYKGTTGSTPGFGLGLTKRDGAAKFRYYRTDGVVLGHRCFGLER